MRFYLTTAIDYVNSRPHLGQAYEKVSADVIARYKRGCGVDTHFLMGNDEHSQNVYKKAREAGLDPLAYCAEMEQVFRERWAELTVSFDDFIRTTEPRHRAAVQKLAQRSYEAGDIYEGTYEGWYCVSCEAFRQEKDLVDGKCPFHPTLTPEWIKEKNYFFRLSKYRDRLLAHFEANPRFLQPDVRRNEILRLLEAGLDDISMSRAGQAWGIPLPFAPENVVYVWFDALINYASAVGYGTDDARFAQWWPADLHIIGKDITRFHTVVWPAMLWSAGVEAPRQVFGHGWINYGGQRMSKTLGTSVDPADLVAKFGPDPARLYLTKEIAFGNDGDFTWERYEERYNADLANNLGNLVSRVTAMVHKYRAGTVAPAGSGGAAGGGGHRRGRALSRRDGPAGAARGHGRGLRHRDRGQRLRGRTGAVGTGQGSAGGRAPGRGAVRGQRGRARRGDAAAAGDAHRQRRAPAPAWRRDTGRGGAPGSRRRLEEQRGAHTVVPGRRCGRERTWPRPRPPRM